MNLQALSGSRIHLKRLGLVLSCAVCLSVSTAAGPRSIASLIEEAYQKNPNVHFYEQEIAAARGEGAADNGPRRFAPRTWRKTAPARDADA